MLTRRLEARKVRGDGLENGGSSLLELVTGGHRLPQVERVLLTGDRRCEVLGDRWSPVIFISHLWSWSGLMLLWRGEKLRAPPVEDAGSGIAMLRG